MSYTTSAYGRKSQDAKQPDPPPAKPSTAQSWKQAQRGQQEYVPDVKEGMSF
jgi:hypothetical protein